MKLISFTLCPYAQRVSIALDEKARGFERINIDLSNKPDWFGALSPHGKVPVLLDGDIALYESVAILEYLEDTVAPALHPANLVDRARHRAWIGFGGSVLDGIGRLYSAQDGAAYRHTAVALRGQFAKLEDALGAHFAGPWFGGEAFSLVDAVYAPVFRYFDLFDQLLDHGILDDFPNLAVWREALAGRPSVRRAVRQDYIDELKAFLMRKQSVMVSPAAA